MTGGAFDDRLGGLLVENAGVDGAIVELREGEDRRQSHAAIAALERTRLKKRKDECGDLIGKLGVCLTAEG